MRVQVFHTDKDCNETLINIRYMDEVAEEFGIADDQIDEIEKCLRERGVYYISANVFLHPARS